MEDFFADAEGDEILKNLDFGELDSNQLTASEITAPESFPFPFEPYPQQVDLMKKLYDVFEEGKVGVFESPTGTGKTMSLLCGSLRWLADNESREQQHLVKLKSDLECEMKTSTSAVKSVDDWVTAFQVGKKKQHQLNSEITTLEKKLSNIEYLRELKARAVSRKPLTSRENTREITKYRNKQNNSITDSADFGVKEDGVGITIMEGDKTETEDQFLLQDDTTSAAEIADVATDNPDKEVPKITQIFFCSRTHSQLSQVFRELQSSPYAQSTACVDLGSRKSLCINPAVQALGSLSWINERCLEMQQSTSSSASSRSSPPLKKARIRKKAACSKCKFKTTESVDALAEAALTSNMDIEDLLAEGRRTTACPYYATRRALSRCQLVLLPYPNLLHPGTRHASGVSLSDSLVIIDEAHNLLDTLAGVHGALLSAGQLTAAVGQLQAYLQRYKSRLSATNLLAVKQIHQILIAFNRFLNPTDGTKSKPGEELMRVSQLLFVTNLDNLNIFELVEFMRSSRLARKVFGVARQIARQAAVEHPTMVTTKAKTTQPSSFLTSLTGPSEVPTKPISFSSTPPIVDDEQGEATLSALSNVESFLSALTTADDDARISVIRKSSTTEVSGNNHRKSSAIVGGAIKLIVLNPGKYLKDIVREARSVVLAGGTMQPLSEFRDQVFRAADCPQERLVVFSCGHVVSSETQLLPLILPTGSSGRQLDFTFQSRSDSAIIKECGETLKQFISVIPGGVVVFFPSYQYCELVLSEWTKTGLLTQLARCKAVFQEPRSPTDVDALLRNYTTAINSQGGALLFCVVGAKMSEGINFSDDLGRCVVLVGMPYPNPKSPELREKMAFLRRAFGVLESDHLEKVCMKAVNQSIGRAIRHREDFACVLLLDRRYQRAGVRSLLPGWIRSVVKVETDVTRALEDVARFFATHQK